MFCGTLLATLALAVIDGMPAAQAQTGTLRLEPVADERIAPTDRLAGSSGAVDETGAGRAFVEIVAERATGFVGELLEIEVRFGLEARFLKEELIPLYRRALDVPVQLEANWLDDPAMLALTQAFVEAREPTVTFARNQYVARARRSADRSLNGSTFRVFVVDVRHLVHTAGVVHLECPRLVFARGVAFTDDFLNGRIPTERADAFVTGRALEIAVRALPELGRPPEFSGAVGKFQLDARCYVATSGVGVDARVSARLELALHGDGDLSAARIPDAADFPGLRLLGVLDDHGRSRRNLTYDLECGPGGPRRVPEIAFAYFDPEPPGEYRVTRSPPFDLPILAIAALEIGEEPTSPGFGRRVAALAFVAVGALALFVLLARRRSGPGK